LGLEWGDSAVKTPSIKNKMRAESGERKASHALGSFFVANIRRKWYGFSHGGAGRIALPG
jgi:hypothetical protein